MAHTHKLIDGVRIDLTAEEITALNTADAIENKKMADARVIYDNNEYQRDRASEYPELKEQLDLLYKDMLADKGDKTGEWFKAVKKIKDDNPK